MNRSENMRYEEAVAHGNLLFPLNVYTTASGAGQKMVLYYHRHREFEIFCLRKGSVRLQVNGRNFLMGEGEFIVIPPKALHGAFSPDGGETVFQAVVFSPGFIESSMNDRISQKYIEPLKNGGILPCLVRKEDEFWEEGLSLFDSVRDVFEKQLPGYELLIKGKLLELSAGLFRTYGREQEAVGRDPEKTERMRQIVDYIRIHFAERIALPELAARFHMSTGYFCRFFKENMDLTPMEYINHYRAAKAAKRLTETSEKLTQIALESGFGGANYFTIAFKKVFSCTPSEYRKKAGGVQENTEKGAPGK